MARRLDVEQRENISTPDSAGWWPVDGSWRRIVEVSSLAQQASSLASDTQPSLFTYNPTSGARGENLVAGMLGSSQREEFARELRDLLMSESDEDGPSELAREFAEWWLARFPAASGWIQSFFLGNITHSGLASDTLRLVGRLSRRLVYPWGFVMAMAALSQPNIRVRDAAVRALERWGGPMARQILAAHQETVPWLRRYVAGVISDLQS